MAGGLQKRLVDAVLRIVLGDAHGPHEADKPIPVRQQQVPALLDFETTAHPACPSLIPSVHAGRGCDILRGAFPPCQTELATSLD